MYSATRIPGIPGIPGILSILWCKINLSCGPNKKLEPGYNAGAKYISVVLLCSLKVN